MKGTGKSGSVRFPFSISATAALPELAAVCSKLRGDNFIIKNEYI